MKKLFLVLAACLASFVICSCEANPENCDHKYTEFKLCTKCGHYDGINRYDINGRRPRVSWTVGDDIYLEFRTSEKGAYKLILSCSSSGLPHESWNECTENLKCFDKKGNEIKLFKSETDPFFVTLSELNADESYYLSFKYIKEPIFYPAPAGHPELQEIVDILNNDKTAIYFWSYLISE